jgi:hypothetical protein
VEAVVAEVVVVEAEALGSMACRVAVLTATAPLSVGRCRTRL